jgi:hypothetical protein
MRGTDSALLASTFSTMFSGITALAEWLGLIAGKQAGDATALAEIKATGAGAGTYDPATDSVEAIRDRGDAAWITATGFSTLVATDIVSAGAITTLAGVVVNVNLVDTLTTYTNNTPQTADHTAGIAAITVAGPTKAEMDTAHALLATPAQVNTEVVDVIRTDTATELSAVPAASPALHTMVQLIYMGLRNKLDVTATTKEVHVDAGTVLGTKSLSDDATTYSEAKMS